MNFILWLLWFLLGFGPSVWIWTYDSDLNLIDLFMLIAISALSGPFSAAIIGYLCLDEYYPIEDIVLFRRRNR